MKSENMIDDETEIHFTKEFMLRNTMYAFVVKKYPLPSRKIFVGDTVLLDTEKTPIAGNVVLTKKYRLRIYKPSIKDEVIAVATSVHRHASNTD